MNLEEFMQESAENPQFIYSMRRQGRDFRGVAFFHEREGFRYSLTGGYNMNTPISLFGVIDIRAYTYKFERV